MNIVDNENDTVDIDTVIFKTMQQDVQNSENKDMYQRFYCDQWICTCKAWIIKECQFCDTFQSRNKRSSIHEDR